MAARATSMSAAAPARKRADVMLADRGLERLARREADDPPLRDRDGRTRLRVACGARLALRGLERAAADECDRVAFLQRFRDAVYQRFDRGLGARFRRAGVRRDLGDQFLFVHAYSWEERVTRGAHDARVTACGYTRPRRW